MKKEIAQSILFDADNETLDPWGQRKIQTLKSVDDSGVLLPLWDSGVLLPLCSDSGVSLPLWNSGVLLPLSALEYSGVLLPLSQQQSPLPACLNFAPVYRLVLCSKLGLATLCFQHGQAPGGDPGVQGSAPGH